MRLATALMVLFVLVAACTSSDAPEVASPDAPIAESHRDSTTPDDVEPSEPGEADEPVEADEQQPDPTTEPTPIPTPVPTETRPPIPDGLDEGRLRVFITGRSVVDSALNPRPHADDAQLQLLIDRTPLFTEQTGIPVEYTFVRQSRELLNLNCASGCSLDVVLLDLYEIPLYGNFEWTLPLDSFASADAGWDENDLTPSVRAALSAHGPLGGAPLTAGSSFLTYRADLVADAGLSISDEPSWSEVSEIARSLESADNETAGICLQSEPSWDSAGWVFTTILNTFGGSWWTADPDGNIGVSQVDEPEFREAFAFYVDLLLEAGPEEPLDIGFRDCLELYQSGKVAMWLDSTAAGPLVEADDSPVQGLNGYAQAPTVLTESGSWLEGRGFTVFANAASPELSWEYIRWATSTNINDGSAAAAETMPGFGIAWQPLFDDPIFRDAHGPALDATIEAALTQPRPAFPSIQYIGGPEFQNVAGQCMQQLDQVLAGQATIDGAVDACHQFATKATQ